MITKTIRLSKRGKQKIALKKFYDRFFKYYAIFMAIIMAMVIIPIDTMSSGFPITVSAAGKSTVNTTTVIENITEKTRMAEIPETNSTTIFTYTKPSIVEELIEIPDEPLFDDKIIEITQPDYYHEKFSGDSIIKSKSGLTASQIDELLHGTNLYGLGEVVMLIEETNGVNAYFTISIATLESARGTSRMAMQDNNLFGIMNKSFESFYSCVVYFGKLMDKYQNSYKLTMSPNGIGPTYCETSDWSYEITKLMNQYVMNANVLF